MNCSVFILDINEIPQEYSVPPCMLSDVRKERIARAQRKIHKHIMLCTELLLCYALRTQNALQCFPIEYTYDEFGKPIFSNVENVQISISHSGDYVCCALSDVSIGVDIEHKNISQVNMSIARHVASVTEQIETPCELLTKWVKKEAYMKLCGKGFSLPMTRFVEQNCTYLSEEGEKLGYCTFATIENDCMLAIAMHSMPSAEYVRVSGNDITEMLCAHV